LLPIIIEVNFDTFGAGVASFIAREVPLRKELLEPWVRLSIPGTPKLLGPPIDIAAMFLGTFDLRTVPGNLLAETDYPKPMLETV
jgi:hypothetical protein